MSTALSFQDHQHVFCNLMLNHLNGDKAASWFDPKCGLCHNFQMYLRDEGLGMHIIEPLLYEFKMSFPEYLGEPINVHYPFNTDIWAYFDEANNGQLYANAKRLGYLIKYAK